MRILLLRQVVKLLHLLVDTFKGLIMPVCSKSFVSQAMPEHPRKFGGP